MNRVEETCLGPLQSGGGFASTSSDAVNQSRDGGGGGGQRRGDRGSKGVGKLINKISQISQSDLPGIRKPSTPGEEKC